MKKSILSFIILLTCFYFSKAQQNVVFPVNGNESQSKQTISNKDESVIPDDLKAEKFYEEYNFPIPVILYGDDYNALVLEAKEKVVEAVFYSYCREYSNLTCALLIYHAGNLVKIPVQDFIAPTKGKEKDKGAYKFYAESAKVNKALINYIAEKSNIFFRESTVVLYHPCVPKGQSEISLFEDTRRRFQSAFNEYIYKMLSLKNIDVMPVCENVVKDDGSKVDICNQTGINVYRELMLCMNSTTRINAPVLIVIRDIKEKHMEQKGDMYESTVEIAVDIFNSHTYSLILTNFYMASAEFKTKAGAVDEAIKKIIKEQIDTMMFQMTATYYNYIMDGKEISIEIKGSCYKDDNDLKTFEEAVTNSRILKITNISQKPDRTVEYKCLSYEPLQFEVVRLLKEIKPDSITGNIVIEGDAIIFK